MRPSQPEREYRNWVMDSRRWQHYHPRPGDIVVATYPKCGTTWMQRIVNLLIFRSTDPRPVSKLSPWYDMRTGPPVEVLNEALDSQAHRRAIKTHLPLDGLPFYDDVRYIHVARDGRDACLSFHHHATGFTSAALDRLDKAGVADPEIGMPYPRVPADPAEYFHQWITRSLLKGFTDGYQNFSYFDFHRTYWAERHRPNVLMVHYADLKRDLANEMRRVAEFLEIEIDPAMWPQLVDAASFKTMKAQGDDLMPSVMPLFEGGAQHFFHRAENGRWKDIFNSEDLALYQGKIAGMPTGCGDWLKGGRLATDAPMN